ncbi:MAG: hypothetical protein ACI4HP_08505, partial [Ruminococcus sp.]
MKKLVSMLMVFTLLFSFTACGNNNNAGESEKLQDSASQTVQQTTVSEQEPDSSAETSSAESNPVETETKSLVAYFSCTG